MTYRLAFEVNGVAYEEEIEPQRSLLSVLRAELGLTGAKEGCDDSECGACMVLVDGRPVNSCSFLALQASGRAVQTVEGLSADALLEQNPHPTEAQVRRYLGGNLCRCTGYSGIVRAVLKAAADR
jgi:aerobic-type carbon monoxide dehydrogenase small subunit (CoxS/CutS family)